MKEILEAASRAHKRENQERRAEEGPPLIDLLFPKRSRDERSDHKE